MGNLFDICRKNKNEDKRKLKNMDDENKQIFSFSKAGIKKDSALTDQDAYDEILYELGNNIKYFGVYDGHGVKGREASIFARDEIRKSLIKEKSNLANLKERKIVEKLFKKIFLNVHEKFKNSPNDYEQSGTCVIGVLIVNENCFCINLGDSRCVIGSKKSDPNITIFSQKTAYQMTVDHKANREDEKKRIESKNGIVNFEKNLALGPPRVYPRNDDGPGLAVSRSLGDLILHNYGVIAEPEITHKELDQDDKFIVIGSDGIWDVMNSSEVIGFIFDKIDTYNKERICEELVNEARFRWDIINSFKIKLQNEKNKELNPTSINSKAKHIFSIDDITSIICFLEPSTENKSIN